MSTPTRTLKVFYWVLNLSNSSSSVDIDDNCTVDDLRKKIVNENPVGLAQTDAAGLSLWKVSIPVTKKLCKLVSECQFLDEAALLEVDVLFEIFPPPQPVERTLHIVVQVRQLRLKRSLGDQITDERRLSKKRSKELPVLSQKELQAMDKVFKRIHMLSADPTEYSDPNKVFDLPFPSVNQIPSCFSLLDECRFSYMGRECFSDVWEKFCTVKDNPRQHQAIYLYGVKGFGRSYILAALACLLVRTGTQVVYFPNCRAWLFDPLRYLRVALFFAFVNSEPSFREEIVECKDVESLADFCARYRSTGQQLCFIVDQLDALDAEPLGQDVVPDTTKDSLRHLLYRMSARHILITSASVNHKNFHYMVERDTGEDRIPLMGGMSSSEMSLWWKHHNFTAFSDVDKQKVEDLTGCIPLFLKSFVMHHGKTLKSLEPRIWVEGALESVHEQIIKFAIAKKHELQHYTEFRDNFAIPMRNCLLGVPIPGSGRYIDHRYFYADSQGNGRCSCGLARQAITEFLRIYVKESIFLGVEWYDTLMAFKNNPCAIGFIVEQVVICKLASTGLHLGNFQLPPARTFAFNSVIPRLSIDKPHTYYVPVRFNQKTIDLLFASIDQERKIAHIVPMQIAIAKDHEDSETAFFADVDILLHGMEGFQVKKTFLWIHHGKQGRKEVMKKLKELRSRAIKINPDYEVLWVSIEQIDDELDKILKKIRQSQTS